MNKDKTIKMLLNRIDLTICNIPRNIKILGKNENLIDYIKYDFIVLDYELDLLIRVLNKVLKNGN
jgi:hypothetical protein